MGKENSEPPSTAKGVGPGESLGWSTPSGWVHFVSEAPVSEVGIRRALPPHQDRPGRTLVGSMETVNLLLTNPLTPFLLLRVFLT